MNDLITKTHMSPDQNGHIFIDYPVLIVSGKQYLAYSDFIDLSGVPKTSLYKMLCAMPMEVISDVKITIKNRAYFRLDFCLRYHRWRPAKN